LKLDFELNFVVEDGYVELATFEILWKNVGEYGGGVNDDDDDTDEHLANNRHNFDCPINITYYVYCLRIIAFSRF